RREGLRGDAVHHRDEGSVRPVRVARPARRPARAHHARGRDVDLLAAAGAHRRAMAGCVSRGGLRTGTRGSLHPALQAEDPGRAGAAPRPRLPQGYGGQEPAMTRRMLAIAVLLALSIGAAAAQQPSGTQSGIDALEAAPANKHPIEADTEAEVRHALFRLPLAAALGAALAFRPKRRGTPPRQPAVIQTQIILAIVGSLVMLV